MQYRFTLFHYAVQSHNSSLNGNTRTLLEMGADHVILSQYSDLLGVKRNPRISIYSRVTGIFFLFCSSTQQRIVELPTRLDQPHFI